MKPKNYFYAAFFMPIVVPGLAWALSHLNFTKGPHLLGGGIIFLTLSGIVGGIPYAVFYAGFLIWARRREVPALLRFTWIAPVLFTGVFSVFWFIYSAHSYVSAPEAPWYIADLMITGYYAIFCLLLGYGYVAVIRIGYFLFEKLCTNII